ncbi:MAG TPA: carboxypeptidase M32 [Actinomycetota bacterium]|nr:carboxypeptidase M32 [Actinomycetota bacterium]
MPTPFERLLPKLQELTDIGSACALMSWDQAVMMPPAGAAQRARALSTLQGLLHDRLTDPAIGELLAELEASGDEDLDVQASVRVLRRDHDRATKIPGRLVRAIAEAEGLAYQAWTEARPAADFRLLQPHLERLFGLKKEEADALGWEGERYDALLDNFEPGMTTAEVEAMFSSLTQGLVPLAHEVLDAAGPAPEVLSREFDPDIQMRFCDRLAQALGFDNDRGRLDTSPHPFTIGIHSGDVRQTTKADPKDLLLSVYALIHETGHALYEQGLPERMADLPAGRVPSLGLHESQSRMWENQVGRSRAFTDFLLPLLKEQFPDQLGMMAPEEWYRAVNHPQRTLIRVTSDELTYNLHVALRFELEIALFRDALEVSDLPEAWNDAMAEKIGLRPPSDADGVLQDMHWAMGAIGYFPTYTLGTLYAAAFFDAALRDLAGLMDDLRRGDGSRLLAWLREHIHRYAFHMPAKELGEQVLGGPLTPEPFLAYAREKYTALYL